MTLFNFENYGKRERGGGGLKERERDKIRWRNKGSNGCFNVLFDQTLFHTFCCHIIFRVILEHGIQSFNYLGKFYFKFTLFENEIF